MKKKMYALIASSAVLGALLLGPISAFASTSGPVNPYSFSVKAGSQAGTVDVMWSDDGATNQYDIDYGTDPNNLTYGSVAMPFNAGSTNSFEVGSLTPGVTYYFSLVGETGNGANNSGPVSIKAPGKAGSSNVLGVSTGPGMAASGNTSEVLGTSVTSGPVGQYSFSATTGSAAGTVNLMWKDDGSSAAYDIVYGTIPGQYVYGLVGMPFNPRTTNSFTVGSLVKGKRYYFALVSEGTQITSNPVSAVAR